MAGHRGHPENPGPSRPHARRPGEGPGFATRAIHGAVAPPVHQQPSSTPLYQTSTWRFDTLQEFADVISHEGHGGDGGDGGDGGHTGTGYVYGRGYGNPTVAAFEATMASLEGTEAAMAFDSGMSALHTVFTTLARSGEFILADPAMYGGTHSLLTTILPRYGIEVLFQETREIGDNSDLHGAKAYFMETIANPLLRVPALDRVGLALQLAGVASVVDNTLATPYLCTPAQWGFTYVVHSASKYIGGHSDLVGGVVCGSASAIDDLRRTARDTGGAMQPFEAWLCLRGLATLALRMERHCATAQAVAELLFSQPQHVDGSYYPGLTIPEHALASRILCGGYGGMVSFDIGGGLEAARRFCEALKVAWIGASLGGPHTLVAHPALTTHRQVDKRRRLALGMDDGFIRISVGLEDPDDLLADIQQALEAAHA